jgi:membrane-associated phospholipid phosphatase
VPLGFLTVWTDGTLEQLDRFWVAVLLAGFACYVSLPWLVSRPPRLVEPAPASSSAVASFNVSLLGKVSHQLNTFPSGHVAVAAAIALAVAPVWRIGALLFAAIAAGIAIGAALGRYHYGVDVLAGALVGIVAAQIAL